MELFKRFLGGVGLVVLSTIHPACRSPRAESVQIFDDERGRRLVIGHRVRAYADTATWESGLRYVAVMSVPMHFFAKPGRMLLLGLAGGSIAKSYTREHWSVEAAEGDSAIIAIARRSFGLRADEVSLRGADGREILASHTDRYEIILEDAVGAPKPALNLMTSEFFALVSSRLEEGGVFGISFECAGWNDPFVLSMAATLKQQFRYVVALPIAEPPTKFGSIVLVASNTPHEHLAKDVERNTGFDPEWRFGPEYQKTHAWDNRFVPEISGAAIQTDTLNRLDGMLETLDDSARVQPSDYLP